MLNNREKQVLRMLETGPRVMNDPTPALMKRLQERGYVSFHNARSGPLGTFTGELMAQLTEAGKLVVEAYQNGVTE